MAHNHLLFKSDEHVFTFNHKGVEIQPLDFLNIKYIYLKIEPHNIHLKSKCRTNKCILEEFPFNFIDTPKSCEHYVSMNIKRLVAAHGLELIASDVTSSICLTTNFADFRFYFEIRKTFILLIVEHEGFKFSYKCKIATCFICKESDCQDYWRDAEHFGVFCRVCYSVYHTRCNSLNRNKPCCNGCEASKMEEILNIFNF